MTKVMLGMSLLCSGAFAAFIQSPIPPSTQQNFVRDTDGDGRMDQMEIRFLGNLTKEYVSSMLDSLTFEWIDSSGAAKHYTVAAGKFQLNPANKRSLIVDLKGMQKSFRLLTALSTMEFSAAIYGSALLYLRDGSMYPVALKDAMAPAIMSAYLRNMRGKSNDSLTVLFSETVRTVPGCPALLEYKSAKDGKVRKLKTDEIRWNFWMNSAVFVLDKKASADGISFRDSLRLVSGCVEDTSGNAVSKVSQFSSLTGYSPFEVVVPSMAVDSASRHGAGAEGAGLPIFQLNFQPLPVESARDTAWGVYMDVLGEEFENALREILKMDEKTPVSLSKLKVRFDIRIYTNLGAYVVGTRADIAGNDERLGGKPTQLSLRWNFMDSHGRRVSTGVYIANVTALVEYDGKAVFRNGTDATASYVFGVVRR